MRTLTLAEANQISGGFINVDALFEGIVLCFGVGVAVAFLLGVGAVYAYQALTAR